MCALLNIEKWILNERNESFIGKETGVTFPAGAGIIFLAAASN
jgi:hypothetical protein